jgi:preprotein translocase subunit SecA
MLGLTVGVVRTEDTPDQRRKAYACDITYGTAKEFGFDFMRDRLLLRRLGKQSTDFVGDGSSHRWDESGDKPVQRGMHFALIDEADCILIDEARTPLIIGTYSEKARQQMVATYEWSSEHAPRFERDIHFTLDEDTRKFELTPEGRQFLRAIPQPQTLSGVGLVDLYQYMERAIKVEHDFFLDRQYVVNNGEIVIVDEFTGRLAEGRKWRDGIHQAIEAKERVEVTLPTGQAARITMQDLVLRYRHLAGMTGTAITSAREFQKIYKMPVVQIPTNRPCVRKGLPEKVFGSMDEKWVAVAEEIRELHSQGRPVLIGTRSIDKSEALSRVLTDKGIPHQVLNAREIAKEADIVAQAGQRGKVTVSTNMAGRGTDIKLGEGIAELGGLQVICTELHDAARIDRQLIGRCARQGDPGTFRQYLSLDDDILKSGLGVDKSERLKVIGDNANGEISQYLSYFRKAQRKIERRYFRDRNVLLHQERERNKMQREMGQDPYLDSAD